MPDDCGKYRFWLKKLIFIYDGLVFEMYRCLQEALVTEWITKKKTTLIQKVPPNEPQRTTIDP